MKQKSNVTPLPPRKSAQDIDDHAVVSSLSPREIVSELDRYVIGQKEAKKAVAIALRNRWRRQALKGDMKDEVLPKNILMIGPTGVGKTEISRRLSKLAEAPFIKVEATRFTEVGYVGRDVEQIIRDLLEIAIAIEKERMKKEVYTKAQQTAEERVVDALVGNKASVATRESFRKRLRNILGRKTGHQEKPINKYFPKGLEVMKDIENNEAIKTGNIDETAKNNF